VLIAQVVAGLLMYVIPMVWRSSVDVQIHVGGTSVLAVGSAL
jgi:hypothetical protein